jgi:hypothetical protein
LCDVAPNGIDACENYDYSEKDADKSTMSSLRDALHTMHDQLWDDDRGMVKLYGLHLVRETALGAFVDLENGNTVRAERALREVLKHQYPGEVDSRWAGTFKTHAEQPEAGSSDADGRARTTQWRDYDPNWRQFLAVILWVTERLYGHVLPEDLRTAMQRAVTLAARSEPVDRIAPEYSNIALMQTWLADVTSHPSTLLEHVAKQIERDGDLAHLRRNLAFSRVSARRLCYLDGCSPTRNLRHRPRLLTTPSGVASNLGAPSRAPQSVVRRESSSVRLTECRVDGRHRRSSRRSNRAERLHHPCA